MNIPDTLRTQDTPLSDEELARLDEMLLSLAERQDAARDAEDPADCVRDVSELDGFLLAVTACPLELTPEQWLPAVWGGDAPAFSSDAESLVVLSLLLRHYNSTLAVLEDDIDNYEPLFAYEVDDEGQEFESVDEWCIGFLRGMELAWDAWTPVIEKEMDLFGILRLFGSQEGWEEQEGYPDAEIEALQDGIPDLARTLFALGMEQRAATPTIRRLEPKTGRNDPCPCGSGKKFKQCCGA
jgi:uncharacterized protein